MSHSKWMTDPTSHSYRSLSPQLHALAHTNDSLKHQSQSWSPHIAGTVSQVPALIYMELSLAWVRHTSSRAPLVVK